MAKELGEPVEASDIKNLGAWEVFARLTASGIASLAVSGRIAPSMSPTGLAHSALQHSRLQHSRLLEDVLAERHLQNQSSLETVLTRLPILD